MVSCNSFQTFTAPHPLCYLFCKMLNSIFWKILFYHHVDCHCHHIGQYRAGFKFSFMEQSNLTWASRCWIHWWDDFRSFNLFNNLCCTMSRSVSSLHIFILVFSLASNVTDLLLADFFPSLCARLFSSSQGTSYTVMVFGILSGRGGERSDCSLHFDQGKSIDQSCYCCTISKDGCLALHLYFSISRVNLLFATSLWSHWSQLPQKAVGYLMLWLAPKWEQVMTVDWVQHLFGHGGVNITFAPLLWVILTAIGESLVFLVSLFSVEASSLIVVFIIINVSFFAHFAGFAVVKGMGSADWEPNGRVQCVEMYQNSTHIKWRCVATKDETEKKRYPPRFPT